MSVSAAGAPIAAREFPAITREQLRLYADASGDHNPIHLEVEAARQAGLPGVIAHGMLCAALVAERAEEFVRQDAQLTGARLTQFQTRFRAMVFPGDSLRIGGSVKAAADGLLLLELVATNARGDTVTTGVARYRLESAP